VIHVFGGGTNELALGFGSYLPMYYNETNRRRREKACMAIYENGKVDKARSRWNR
jgi:hypothetical protein